MAVAGTLFLLHHLAIALASTSLSWDRLLHSSPILLSAVAACVFWADEDTSAQEAPNEGQKEDQ
jgi:hypothetical protein